MPIARRLQMTWGDSDPYWDQVVLAARMDGSNGSPVFIDEKGLILEQTGTAMLSTARSMFGGSSALFDGATGCATFPCADMAITGDFTVEMFAYIAAHTAAAARLFSFYQGDTFNGLTIIVTSTTTIEVYCSINGTTWIGPAVVTVPATTWFHIAVSRQGTATRIFLNGVLISTLTVAGTLYIPQAVLGGIGGQLSNTRTLNGNIDFVRVTIGVARYTAAFPAIGKPFNTRRVIIPPPADSLFYFKFNESTLATVFKNENGGFSGTKFNVHLNYAAPRGQALYTPNGCAIPTGVTLPGGDITFSCWMNPNTNLSGRQNVIGDYNSAGASNSGYFCFGINGNFIEFSLGNGSTYYFDNTTYPHGMVIGQWYHWMVSWTGTQFRIYRNGKLIYTVTIPFTRPAVPAARQLTIGRGGDYGGVYYVSLLAKPRLYNRLLTDDEIKSLVQEMTPAKSSVWSVASKGPQAATSHRGRVGGAGYANSLKGMLSQNSGVKQFEVTFANSVSALVGVAEAGASNAQFPGQNAFSWGYYPYSGEKYYNNAGAAYAAAGAVQDVIGVVVDFTAGSLKFYKNGVDLGVAYTGLTGKTLFPTFGSGSGASSIYYGWLNTGEEGFAYPVAGALPWYD